MINALLDISGKIDEDSAAALAHVKAAADSLGISFFIIGALARDILLKLHFGLPPHRATLDLDLGVSVARGKINVFPSAPKDPCRVGFDLGQEDGPL